MIIRLIFLTLATYLSVVQPVELFAQTELGDSVAVNSVAVDAVAADSGAVESELDTVIPTPPALLPTISGPHATLVSTAKPQLATSLPTVDFSTSLLSMAKGLALCIAALLLVVWILKKLKSPIISGQGRALRIIERLPVSAKSSILLVEVNKKRLLVGVGSDPVSLISDFVDSDAVDSSALEHVHLTNIKDDSND